jgi:hypothetical protein
MLSEEFMNDLADRVASRILPEISKQIQPVVAPRYLTLEVAAQYMSKTKRAVEEYVKDGLFPVSRKNGKLWIDRDDIDRQMTKWKR